MKRTTMTMTLATVIALSAVPFTAFAEANDHSDDATEAQMFLAAKLTLQQAGEIAIKELPGKIAEIGFNDEDGRGVYEATVIGADGQESIIKIDSDSGAVLVKGLASVMDDEEDGKNGHDNEDQKTDDGDDEDNG